MRTKIITALLLIMFFVFPTGLYSLDLLNGGISKDVIYNDNAVIDAKKVRLERIGDNFLLYLRDDKGKIVKTHIKTDASLNIKYTKIFNDICDKLIKTSFGETYLLLQNKDLVNLYEIRNNSQKAKLIYYEDDLLLYDKSSEGSLFELKTDSNTTSVNKNLINDAKLKNFFDIFFSIDNDTPLIMIGQVNNDDIYLLLFDNDLYFVEIDFEHLNINFIKKYNITYYNLSIL